MSHTRSSSKNNSTAISACLLFRLPSSDFPLRPSQPARRQTAIDNSCAHNNKLPSAQLFVYFWLDLMSSVSLYVLAGVASVGFKK